MDTRQKRGRGIANRNGMSHPPSSILQLHSILNRRLIVPLCLACLCMLLDGCSTTGLLKLAKHDFPKSGPTNPVVQVMALWQPAQGMGLNNTMGRGFAGQVYFITQQEEIPAQVEGTVRIYVFDDQGPVEEQAKPIHQFDFPAEAWQAHMQVGKLGPTYSVFIPYTRKGRHEAHCSLRLRFMPKIGPTIYSEMVEVELSGGPKRKTHANAEPSDAGESSIDDEPEQAAVERKRARKDSQSARTAPRPATEDVAAPASNPTPPQVPEAAEPASNRQPASVPLTAEETERIVRETMAKLQSGREAPLTLQPDAVRRKQPARQSQVVQAGYEESDEDERIANDEASGIPRRKNPLDEEDE